MCLYIYISSSSSVICQTTGPKPLPKRFLHIVRSRSSSLNWQYPLLSLRSSSSFLRLLPRLLVTSICPFIFSSISRCRRQFLRKMWPIQVVRMSQRKWHGVGYNLKRKMHRNSLDSTVSHICFAWLIISSSQNVRAYLANWILKRPVNIRRVPTSNFVYPKFCRCRCV